MKKFIKTGNAWFSGTPLFQKPKSDASTDEAAASESDSPKVPDADRPAGSFAEKEPDLSDASVSATAQSDDMELVAVIAAAIAASEQIPPDGFVVRTIRKRT
ncbi:MAG: hypothetical protein LIO80_01345 [Lachnospiraceae bacterium]|nr:hypothetical protein [Lachnospiraceae bacterium]